MRVAAKREAKAPPPLPSKAGKKALALHQSLVSMEAFQAFLLPATLLESGSGIELWNICNNNNNFHVWEGKKDERSNLPSPIPEQ